MAITKILARRTPVGALISYILNDSKTDGRLLTAGQCCIHNHLVFNSVNCVTGRKYHSTPQIYCRQIQAISDQLSAGSRGCRSSWSRSRAAPCPTLSGSVSPKVSPPSALWYIRDEKDALRLVNNLIQATTPKGSHESDPYWTRSMT